METEIAIENKTIILSYDDVSRMKDFCCDENGVSRDFMDWYINDNAFFSKTGILIVEDVYKDSEAKYCMAFDFNNSNAPKFSLYDYATQHRISEFRFSKAENTSMSNIDVLLNRYDKQYVIKNKDVVLSFKASNLDVIKQINKADKDTGWLKTNKKRREGHPFGKEGIAANLRRRAKLEKSLDETYKAICRQMCVEGVYFCYAMMYYFAKNKAKEITGIPKDQLMNNGVGKQITSIYKYSGYVNINEAKVYKAVIKKDKNEPVREYGRHIEKWSVRGHYRRVGDKTIWIEPHEKGEGELENRIYGTEKESEVNVIPKVFEVTRTVFDKEESDNTITNVVEKVKVTKTEPVKKEMDILKEPTFIENIRKIWQNFKSKFKRQ